MNLVNIRLVEKKDIVCPTQGRRIVMFKNTPLSVWEAEELEGSNIGH